MQVFFSKYLLFYARTLTNRINTANIAGMTEITTDDFLGGKIHLMQPLNGLRATSDSVLVAAAVPVQTGDTVLDVGCGGGIIPCCLSTRADHLDITGFEIQDDLLRLATENAHRHGICFRPVLGNVADKPSPIHGRQFHHVVSNPPFYTETKHRTCPQTATAYHQKVSLADWLAFCLRHIRAKGTLTLIHRTQELPTLLSLLNGKLGAIDIIPVHGHIQESAGRIIVRGRLDSHRPLRLYPPLTMHTAANTRTQVAEHLLRNGMGLDEILKTT